MIYLNCLLLILCFVNGLFVGWLSWTPQGNRVAYRIGYLISKIGYKKNK